MRSDAKLRLLDKHAVNELVVYSEVLDAVKQAFTLHTQALGKNFPVVREVLGEQDIFGIKTGYVQSRDLLGFKAAGFWPSNRHSGGDAHQATILLIDPHTGRPQCVIDGNAITTLRTSAAGALGISLLARPDSKRISVFGTGVQGRAQLGLALQVMPSLQQATYVTRSGRPNPEFEALFSCCCKVVHNADGDAAVADADIVITCTPGRGALFQASSVRPGTHLSCVGTDTIGKRELPVELLRNSTVFVDDCDQASRLGEMQWAPNLSSAEIGTLLTGSGCFVRKSDEITIFDMTGIALQDLILARTLFERAEGNNAGQLISWAW